MAQPRPALEDGFQNDGRTVAVLDVGGVNDDTDQQAQRVEDDVPLAAQDFLAGIKATNAAAFRGFHALPVDDAGGRARLSAFPFVRRHDQFIVNGAQQSCVPPAPEILLHRRERREVFRQKLPCAA